MTPLDHFLPLRQESLDRLLQLDGPRSFSPGEGICVACRDSVAEPIRCLDCIALPILCGSCALRSHRDGDIFHRLEVRDRSLHL